MDLTKLAAPFPRPAVHWRVQGTPTERNGKFVAKALAYIDARDVMDRLDDVCGPGGWQAEFTETPKGRVICRLGVKSDSGEWVWKSDGAGDTDVEGEKGGISDALKRAAVHWGVGRYLYRLSSPWLECEVNQKNGKVFWKRWTQDPWSKVQEVGYQPTLPPEDMDEAAPLSQQAAARAPAPPAEKSIDVPAVKAWLIKQIRNAPTPEALDKVQAHATYKQRLTELAAADAEAAKAVVGEGAKKRLAFGGIKDAVILGEHRVDAADLGSVM